MFHFDLVNVRTKIEMLEMEMTRDDFWNDPVSSQEDMRLVKTLKDKLEAYETLANEYEDLMTLIEIGIEEAEESLIPEVKELEKAFLKDYEAMRIGTLLSETYDAHNAIVSLHAGAGGTESCDWVNMLFRMYSKWSDKKNFKIEVLDYLDGEETGLKSITFQVNGENAYGYLKTEKGVHRLVRISPFDSSGRRHTTFASCDVLPELDDTIELDIPDEELRIDTYRSSGAGGQHINKTDSAIRITHLPTNTVVQCQNERSQHKNKDKAMAMLKAKLMIIKQAEQSEMVKDIRGEIKEIGWGSQIRSYVMHPYSMVKDHRTLIETSNVNAVMDGDLDSFINGYLIWLATTNQS